jgi:hypothetical protein
MTMASSRVRKHLAWAKVTRSRLAKDVAAAITRDRPLGRYASGDQHVGVTPLYGIAPRH